MFLATHGVLRRSSAFVPPVFADTYSFEYDGVSDYLSLSTYTDIRPTNAELNSQKFSISLWLKANSLQTGGLWANSGIGLSTYYGLDCTILSTGKIGMNKYDGGGTASHDRRSAFTTNAVITNNNWYHVAFIFGSASFNDFEIYVNGISVPVTTSGTGADVQYTNSYEGGIGASRLRFFAGKIDETSVYNYKLTSTDISNIYGSGVPTDVSSLNPVGYWRAENGSWDGSKWTITDAGSGGNDAESVSMTLSSRSTDVP